MAEDAVDGGDRHDQDTPGLGRWRQRRERIDQLHERDQQRDDHKSSGSGSSVETLSAPAMRAREAQERGQAAAAHAKRAHNRAVAQRRSAADVHDRVARMLDEHGEPHRAQRHEAACQDREAADRSEQEAAEE